MESPSASLINLMKIIKRKVSSLTLSSRSFPSLKRGIQNEGPMEMNPRMLENDPCIYQKDPDLQSPVLPSHTGKTLRLTAQEPEKPKKAFKTLNPVSALLPTLNALETRSGREGNWPSLKLCQSAKIRINNTTIAKSFEGILRPNWPKTQLKRVSKWPEPEKHKKKTLFEVLSNFYLTKKFINTLKSITSKRTPKFLSRQQFSIINDLCFFFDIWKTQESEDEPVSSPILRRKKTVIFETLYKKTRTFLISLEVFDNSSTFMIFWNLLHLVFILFFFFTVPLEACFDVSLSDDYTFAYYMQSLGGYFFLGDIIVNCNTAVYLKGRLIKDRFRIIKNYMKARSLKDLVSIIPIFFHMTRFESFSESFLLVNFVRALFFLRMFNFSAIIKNLEEMFFIDQSIHNILALLKLIFRIILLSHIFACLWFYIGTLSTTDSWLIHYGVASESWWNRYVLAYYYVCVTMNTVGYGDVTAQNSYERLFTIVFIYIACGIFAYSLNCIGVIVSEIAKRENEFQKDLNLINEFMKQKKINFDLRMRVRKYLEYIWYEEKIEKIEEQSRILEKLSDSLKEELLLEANGGILRDLKMFSLNFSEELLRNTIPLLREVRFTPEDLIFLKGTTSQNALYIIRKGKVEIFLDTPKRNNPITVLRTLHSGEVFGEISFFSQQERLACARSTDFTTAYMIRSEDFINLLRRFPRDYQKYCEIKDSINLYGDFTDLYLRCYSCNESSHLALECPGVNYKPIKDVLLHRFFNSVDQKREVSLSKKRRSRRINAILNQKEIERKSFDIQAFLFPIHETERTSNNISEYSEKQISQDCLNSSFEELEQTIKEESNETSSGECLKVKTHKETSHNPTGNHSLCDYSPPLTLKESFENNEIKPCEQMRIQRKNTKGKYFFEHRDTRRRKSNKFKTILENIEGEVYNAILMESSNASMPSLGKSEHDTTPRGSQKRLSANNRKLRSLLSFITDLKEGRDGKKKDKENVNFPNSTTILTDQSVFVTLDLIKSWEFYFTHNNSERIIELFNSGLLRRNRSVKHSSSKSTSPPMRCGTSRRLAVNDHFAKEIEKIVSPSYKRKNFFLSDNVIQKFIKESKFDPEVIKKRYRKFFEKSWLEVLWGKIKRVFCRNEGKKKMKRRVWKENTRGKMKTEVNKV